MSLLTADNCESHHDYEAVQLAKENGVTTLTLPTHTTH